MTNGEHQALAVFEKYVGNIPLTDKMKKLGEEIIELAIAIGLKDNKNIKEEIGDCAAILLHIAYKLDPKRGLTEYILDASDKMEKRKKKARQPRRLNTTDISGTVKISMDRNTLPHDGQKVDFMAEDEIWRTGIYVASDDLFSFENGDFRSAWVVHKWRPIS